MIEVILSINADCFVYDKTSVFILTQTNDFQATSKINASICVCLLLSLAVAIAVHISFYYLPSTSL